LLFENQFTTGSQRNQQKGSHLPELNAGVALPHS
jgi:hypothetical protein